MSLNAASLNATLASTFDDLFTVCAQRDLNLEGVPMYLGLESPFSATAFAPDLTGAPLAGLAEGLFARFLTHTPEPSVRALRLFVETLAQAHFTLELDPAPQVLQPLEEIPEPLLLPKPLTTSFSELLENLRRAAYVRTVNFHNTPKALWAHYDAQLRFYAEHFSAVTELDLTRFFETGRWHKEKPGVLLAFFDTTRNHIDVAAPLLERYGLTGWFFIVPGFIDAPPSEQNRYADDHDLGVVEHEYPDDRLALSWDELRTLGKRHVIASHTMSHTALTERSPDALMVREITGSKHLIEAHLDREVRSFAWLRGSEYGFNPRADAELRKAGYDFLFSTFKLQKLT